MEENTDDRRSSAKSKEEAGPEEFVHPAHRLAHAKRSLSAVLKKNPAVAVAPTGEKRELTEVAGYSGLGFSWPTAKKWRVLCVIFVVQTSMNLNAAIYGNAVPGMTEYFGISESLAKWGQAVFLITYAFGCELWAPFSEELGRRWVLQGSLFFVNVFQLPCALATNFWSIFAGRLLGGLSSAGGSVTLGIVADLWEPAEQQYAVAFVVLSSVAGSVVAPVIGGFLTQYADWRWVFWVQLAFGIFAQLVHLLLVPETRSSILLDKEAQRRRKIGEELDVYGPNEMVGPVWKRISFKHSLTLMWRPYKFLLTEPIVGLLSLLSGFSDALIFSALDSLAMVVKQWDFNYVATGLAFSPLLIAYLLAYLSFLPVYRQDRKAMSGPEGVNGIKPERRLWWLLYTVPLMPIGLFGLAWTSLGPSYGIPWIAPLFWVGCIGVANFAIYMATIDYMVAGYGVYSASATGGNGFCRDFLAGLAALYTKPFYRHFKPGTKWTLVIPTLILSAVGLVLIIPVYVFYLKGEYFRNRSPFAQALAAKREEHMEERQEAITFSRTGTPAGTPAASRRNSLVDRYDVSPREETGRGFRSAPTSRRASAVVRRPTSQPGIGRAPYELPPVQVSEK